MTKLPRVFIMLVAILASACAPYSLTCHGNTVTAIPPALQSPELWKERQAYVERQRHQPHALNCRVRPEQGKGR